MGIELNQLPAVTSAGDDDIVHLQTDGAFVDKHIKKSDLLKEIQLEVDNNTSLTPNIAINTTSIDEDTKSIPHTGGGTLTAKRVNELQDGNNYDLPLANSVSAEDFLDVELTDKFSAFTPSVFRSGGDTISDSVGTDTDFLFDSGSISIRFTSDGVSDWRI